MRNIYFTFLLTFAISYISHSQITEPEDSWSGTYRMEFLDKPEQNTSPEQWYTIKKIANENSEEIASRYTSDLERWAIIQVADTTQHEKKLRRFLFSEDHNEYEQFNWTEQHIKGTMKCVDGGNIFICKTTPKTTVSIDNESFYSNSGIFAVVLHHGVFEFYKEPN